MQGSSASPSSTPLEVAGRTDVGCVRQNNEDALGHDTRVGVFLVCDGMGGQAAGEIASHIAVEAVLHYFREHGVNGNYPVFGKSFEGVSREANALASAIQVANKAIVQAAIKNPARRGMGSTVAAALVHGSQAAVAHVGDSRVYLVRSGDIRQLTDDHSLVMEQVRRGLITREQAEQSEFQNIITRALGSEEEVEPEMMDVSLEAGDILLLTSDGLTKNVRDRQLLSIVRSAATLEAACDLLIQAARDAGGDDNITCLLVRIG